MGVFGDVWGSVHDAGSPVLGYDTYAQQEASERSDKAKQQGTQERGNLEQRNRKLQEGVDGYDEPGITSTENWSGYSHDEIFSQNESISEGKANETAKAWQQLGKGLRDRGSDFDSKLKSIIGNGWQGEAADQASTVGEPVKNWMEGSGNAFEMTGNRLEQAASGAGQAKQMVPEPEGHSWGRTAATSIPLGPLAGGADALAQMKERREAENQARETMERVYSKTYTDVDSKIPQFQKPDGKPVDPPGRRKGDDDGGGGGGNGTGGGGNPGGGGSGGGGNPSTPATPDSPSTPDLPTTPESPSIPTTPESPQTPQVPESPAPSDPSWHTPAPTGPSSTGPGSTGPSAGAGGGGGAGTGAGGGMVGGMAGGAGAGQSMGAGGRAGTGAVGGGRTGGMAGGAGGSSGARGGGAGRGMMGGMGQRGQGGEDDEHEHPSWLEEQDDIWLNDMPKTAPPVLGE